mmetsp:Transcript_128273/g.357035  ORF Transcript_128273/g.357035 Transcript_128273/m.357035 type:complete len:293 (+) Transcript_128273:142-1020(+)
MRRLRRGDTGRSHRNPLRRHELDNFGQEPRVVVGEYALRLVLALKLIASVPCRHGQPLHLRRQALALRLRRLELAHGGLCRCGCRKVRRYCGCSGIGGCGSGRVAASACGGRGCCRAESVSGAARCALALSAAADLAHKALRDSNPPLSLRLAPLLRHLEVTACCLSALKQAAALGGKPLALCQEFLEVPLLLRRARRRNLGLVHLGAIARDVGAARLRVEARLHCIGRLCGLVRGDRDSGCLPARALCLQVRVAHGTVVTESRTSIDLGRCLRRLAGAGAATFMGHLCGRQ